MRHDTDGVLRDEQDAAAQHFTRVGRPGRLALLGRQVPLHAARGHQPLPARPGRLSGPELAPQL